ncbi:MAG: AAA family ATPase [Sphingobacteriales bacterium JAD_PAG50586_3]|nr:MAG: AAA family ATPase [Sphingobacteriales bacterium JAD_PAG50586_3]
MKKPFNPPTVKHDIQLIKTMEPNAKGEMVEKHIVRVTGPGLPGIDYPYKDPSVPDVLKRYSLTDELNKPIKPPEKLWGNYWQTGQLCILAGDMGTGKSTVAIRLAKSLSLTPGPSPKERGLLLTPLLQRRE